MKKNNYRRFIYTAYCFFCALCLLPSCVTDGDGNCAADGIDLTFRYTYNVKESDAFGFEVGKVHVSVFDSDNLFVEEYTDEGDYILNGFTMRIPPLPEGEYTFVAWAHATELEDEYSNYQYTALTKGVSRTADLTARLRRNEMNCCETRLNSVLNGTVSRTIGAERQTVTIDMIKCTNTMRIILMPYRPDQQLDVEDYEFLVNGKSAWLGYDASLYQEDPVIYLPYYKETLTGDRARSLGVRSRANNEFIDNAAVAEINMSRLFSEVEPRFIINNKANGKTLLNINLTWFLSLQAIGERQPGWDDQEYLDRQDNYSITFFIDNDVFMMSHIIVNGWVISLEDNELS